jgi:septum formation inhibitor MinC
LNTISATVLSIMLLLLISTSSLLLVVLSANNKGTIITLAQAKKKEPSSSSHHIRTTTSNSNTDNTIHTSKSNRHLHKDKNQNLHSSTPTTITTTSSPSLSPSTLSLSPSSERPSDVAAPSPEEQQAIVQRLYDASAIAASDNGDSSNNNNFISQIDQQQQTQQYQQQQQQQSCLDSSDIDRFILPLKEARFTHIRPCVTVTGTVISGQKINADGDISFNMAVDPPYEGMLGPGNLDPMHATSSGEHGIHIEAICQEPVISSQRMDAGACDGYNGPDFHSSLPVNHEHVMVTGRFQIEWNEAPGGLTEIHPVYAIEPIPKS